MTVLIRGDGVAARCCGHLLTQAGFQVSIEAGARARVPVILLSGAAQHLTRDIFGRDDLFRGLPQITRRVVAWGADPMEMPHSAVVISEEALLAALPSASTEVAEADWTISAAPPLPAEASEHRFGSRMASALKVEMKDTETCWMEAVEDGWLFLNSGWLLSVGGEDLLRKSTLVRNRIDDVSSSAVRFPASPRMVSPLGGDGWIACGSAAMGFDPLCGDGTAHAVREAILAAAVIRGSAAGDVDGLLAHYEGRLTAGFLRHLGLCRQYYSTGGIGEWWQGELAAVDLGIEWCQGRLIGDFRYRLEGLELVRI